VRTVFVDFAKAFDYVDHNVLVAVGLVRHCPVDTTERQDWPRPVRLVAAVSWHATGIIPRPIDVYHRDRRAATGPTDAQVRG